MCQIVGIRILSISDDRAVRTSRELVMRKDGYEIVSVTSDDLLSVSEIRQFDVAVMCYSVRPAKAMSIVDRLRRYNPDIRLLRVNPHILRIDAFYDADAEVISGPAALLKAVKTLLDGKSTMDLFNPRPAKAAELRRPSSRTSYVNSHAS